MRWVILTGAVLCASVAWAAVLSRVIGSSTDHFVATSPAAHESPGASEPAVDEVPTPRAPFPTIDPTPALAEVASGQPGGEVLHGLLENLAKTSARQEKRKVREPETPLPDETPSGAVEGLAHTMAPSLAKDAREYSAGKTAVEPEVQQELLNVWQEQKQILAGQRETIDTMIEAAH